MAEIKTKVNEASVEEFLSKVENEQKRRDSLELLKIMKQVTKQEPKMWGPAIIGFGSYHYKYESGREGDMPQIAFSPRKQNLTLYIGVGDDSDNPLLKKLGTYTTGKVCLYIKKLADVDRDVLQELIADSFQKAPGSGLVFGTYGRSGTGLKRAGLPLLTGTLFSSTKDTMVTTENTHQLSPFASHCVRSALCV